MVIKVLVENTAASEGLGCEHGLSLYLETKNHKLLFDTGASGLFAENAAKMNVDLTQIDIAFISHGHYDHGGGLKAFLKVNSKAKVYVHQRAFEEHCANRPGGETVQVGLDPTLLPNERFVWTGDRFLVEEGIELFSGVKGGRFRPAGNRSLLMRAGEAILPDDFAHEQNLILEEDGKLLLIAGCAHNGIVNVLERFHALKGRMPDVVMGGFHLYNPAAKASESPAVIREIAACLLHTKAKFYTCHCTGTEAYHQLKTIMGDDIDYLSTGTELIL